MTSDLQALAERGERIYRDRYKAEYEKSQLGMFAVIDVNSERIFVAQSPEGAYQAGLDAIPAGRFYLLKIGSAGVYRVGYSRGDTHRGDRLFQRT